MSSLRSPIKLKKLKYYIQNVDILSICNQIETPFYVYDLNTVLKRFCDLYGCINWRKLRIFYAMKANYNIDILEFLKEHHAFLDTVSPTEVLLAKKLGYNKERLLYTANNMTDKEMLIVKKSGVLFIIDSLSRLEKYGHTYPGTDVCLRFNPEIVDGENTKVQNGGHLTKPGIIFADLSKIKKIIARYKLKVVGLHEHTDSAIFDNAKVYQSMHNLLNIATRENFPDLEFIDFGGGFKLPYHPDEEVIDYQEFGENITKIFSDYCKRYGRELYLYFEPGKYIVAEAGCLILQVNTIKYNKNRIIIGTDSGFLQLSRPVFYDAYHHIINLSNPRGKVKKYDVCGNICESENCFAQDRLISEIREGDFLAILNAGAYCHSMTSIFNLRALPGEVIIYKNNVNISRTKLTYEELADHILDDYKCEKAIANQI